MHGAHGSLEPGRALLQEPDTGAALVTAVEGWTRGLPDEIGPMRHLVAAIAALLTAAFVLTLPRRPAWRNGTRGS